MVDNKYSSHWNLAGEKPYQRYFKAGCRDHITQIFGGYDAPENSPFDTTSEAVMKQVFDMHKKSALPRKRTMKEVPQVLLIRYTHI